jgi:glycosyltransferase involved in cell wall biosynthesis
MADAVQLSLTTPHGVRYCEADIVLVQRVAVQDMETARRIVDSCRRFGRKLVFEIDDDLFGVPEEHPGRTFYAAATEPAKFLARSADAVTTSTERLRSRLLGLNPNTITVPNYVDERLWLPAPEPGSFPAQTVSILYAGTTTHRDDLEFLGAAMRKARSRHGDRVQLDVVGVADEPGDRDWFNVIPMPHYAALSYPRFVSWIRDQNRWQWGVAPLLDSEFNRCKSPIKYLEYAALGLPGIYSDLPVYSDLVRDGESGLLAANDPDRWFALLDRVVDDADLWARLRAGCQAALSEHTLSRNAEALKRVWRDLAGGPPGAAMETAGSAAVSRSREVHP